MPYSDDQVTQMIDAFTEWRERIQDLSADLIIRSWPNPRSQEYATHGFCRRVNMLEHCMDRTFDLLPPQADRPDRGLLMDVTAFVQTFYANVYGAFDNLAHLWVSYHGITKPNGEQLSRSQIGFSKKQVYVWRTLPQTITNYLDNLADWREYFEGYRHALAHRISLYIPPLTLSTPESVEHEALGREVSQAITEGRRAEVHALIDRQSKLGKFVPLLTHSYGEGARPVRFHAQMVCDFSTLGEFSEIMMREIAYPNQSV